MGLSLHVAWAGPVAFRVAVPMDLPCNEALSPPAVKALRETRPDFLLPGVACATRRFAGGGVLCGFSLSAGCFRRDGGVAHPSAGILSGRGASFSSMRCPVPLPSSACALGSALFLRTGVAGLAAGGVAGTRGRGAMPFVPA